MVEHISDKNCARYPDLATPYLEINLPRVTVVDELREGPGLDPLYDDPVEPLLQHAPGEHGGEVVRGGGQQQAVAGEGPLARHQRHISQQTSANEALDSG